MTSTYEPKVLARTQFGNPVLQTKTRQLEKSEIKSDAIQNLIADMRYTLSKKDLGVGLAAPQVGESVALSVIQIQPRGETPGFETVIINPKIVECIGKKEPKWEGCLSFGSEGEPPFAQTMRYKKVRVTYLDERAESREVTLGGLPAHVFQHEADHLNGILFPERVEDSKSWMNTAEYKRMIAEQRKAVKPKTDTRS